MTSNIRVLTLAFTLSVLAALLALADEPPSPSKTNATDKASSASLLQPLAFLAGGQWEAKLPAKPDGARDAILAQFTWSDNHRAIRISNAFVLAGKPRPYIDGLYAWNPQKRMIVFWYVDAAGSLTEGTVKTGDGTLLHEFQETDSAGEVKQYTARVTPVGRDAWENEIFTRKDGRLEPIIKVRYERMK